MNFSGICFLIIVFLYDKLFCIISAKDPQDCEVCIKFVDNLLDILKQRGIERTQQNKVEKVLLELCDTAVGKDQKLCYYIGARSDSATRIVNELVKPITNWLPSDKVCQKLKEKDAQICDLRIERTIDWKTVDLNKLRVKDLKKVLDDWGEQCKACTEKSEFVRKVKELMPKYVKNEL